MKYYYFYPLDLVVTSKELDIENCDNPLYTEISELVYNVLNT